MAGAAPFSFFRAQPPAVRRPSTGAAATTTTAVRPLFVAPVSAPPFSVALSSLPGLTSARGRGRSQLGFPSLQGGAANARSAAVLPDTTYSQCQTGVPEGRFFEENTRSNADPAADFIKAERSLQWIPNDEEHHDEYALFHATLPEEAQLPIPFPSQFETLDGVFNYLVRGTPVLSFYYRVVRSEQDARQAPFAFFVHLMRWNGMPRLASVENIAAPELLGFAITTLRDRPHGAMQVLAVAVDLLAFPRFNYFLWCLGWKPEFLVSSTPYAVGVHETTWSNITSAATARRLSSVNSSTSRSSALGSSSSSLSSSSSSSSSSSPGPTASEERDSAEASASASEVPRDVHLITNTLTMVYLAPHANNPHGPRFSSSFGVPRPSSSSSSSLASSSSPSASFGSSAPYSSSSSTSAFGRPSSSLSPSTSSSFGGQSSFLSSSSSSFAPPSSSSSSSLFPQHGFPTLRYSRHLHSVSV